MIDIWLVYCLLVPFAFILVQTAIECYRDDDKELANPGASRTVTPLFVKTEEENNFEEGKDKIYNKDPKGRQENHASTIRKLYWAGWFKVFWQNESLDLSFSSENYLLPVLSVLAALCYASIAIGFYTEMF